MWKHLKDHKRYESHPNKLPRKRYYKVVIWIACHAFLDIIALIVFAVARMAPGVAARERSFLDYLSTPVVAFHVGCYPIVYCGVRDLKFHDKVRQQIESSKKTNMTKPKTTRTVEEMYSPNIPTTDTKVDSK